MNQRRNYSHIFGNSVLVCLCVVAGIFLFADGLFHFGRQERVYGSSDQVTITVVEHAIETDFIQEHNTARIVDQEITTQPELSDFGLSVGSLRSAPGEEAGITYCSKTARITLQALTNLSYSPDRTQPIPQGDAIQLLLEGIENERIVAVGSIDTEQDNNTLQEALRAQFVASQQPVADFYLYRDSSEFGQLRPEDQRRSDMIRKAYLEQAHRAVLLWGDDQQLYVLDPYRGNGSRKPQRFNEYLQSMSGWTFYLGSTYDPSINMSIIHYYEASLTKQKPPQKPEDTSPKTQPSSRSPSTDINTLYEESGNTILESYLTKKQQTKKSAPVSPQGSSKNQDIDLDEVRGLLGL